MARWIIASLLTGSDSKSLLSRRYLPSQLKVRSTIHRLGSTLNPVTSSLRLTICFANPHAPWERGTNENTNGLLRDWFPKGSDFRKVTAARLAQVERMLNNRPRKWLNYRTPAEVLNALPGVALRN